MREVEVNSGMSLLDVALQNNGTIDTALEIARMNNLPLDYCFEQAQTIPIPDDTNYYSKKIEQRKETFCTGIIDDVVWILTTGYWDDENVWIDNEMWND